MDLTKRLGKDWAVLQLIEQARSEELYTTEELLQLSYLCRDAPCADLVAAKAALSAALQGMRSQREPPQMDTFAEVIPSLLIALNDAFMLSDHASQIA